METVKAFGSAILGFLFFIGMLLAIVLLLGFGTNIVFAILPIVNWVAAIAIILNVLLVLPLLIFRKTRAFAATTMFLSSLVFGLATWLYGFAVTYIFLGIGWVFIGIFILGVGVVPIGMIGTAIHGHWEITLGLLLNMALTFGARFLSIWASEHVAPKNTKRVRKDSGKVLLAYDLEPTTSVITNRLRHDGYNVRVVRNGEDALAGTLSFKPDIIITDIMLPKVSGFDVIDIIRSTPETEAIPIIVISGLTQKADIQRADDLGATAYMVRDGVTPSDVSDAVKRYIQ